jgi:hypothetical protein
MRDHSNADESRSDVATVDIEPQFKRLAAQWQTESEFMSSMTDMVMLPSYQRIIGLGREAVPLLLRELERQPDYWFWALQAVTGHDPVNAADRGDLRKMSAAWLVWAKREGYGLVLSPNA